MNTTIIKVLMVLMITMVYAFTLVLPIALIFEGYDWFYAMLPFVWGLPSMFLVQGKFSGLRLVLLEYDEASVNECNEFTEDE